MNLQKLKSLYDGARGINGHNQDRAAKEVGKSKSMINQVLSGEATSKPTEDALLQYCYDTGLQKTAEDMGLGPDMKMQSQPA